MRGLRHLTIWAVSAACLLFAFEARADERRPAALVTIPGTARGTGDTFPLQATSTSSRMVGVAFTSTGTAGACGFYDVANVQTGGNIVNANLRFEIGAPASETRYIDLTASPVDFNTGVAMFCANTAGVVAFQQQD